MTQPEPPIPPRAIPAAWLDRARELAASPAPAWAERGEEILRGDL